MTGMRLSEAMGIERDDVDLDTGVLTVRLTKFGKSRLVPLHPTTSAALRSYANRRDGHLGLRCGSTFFVAEKGGRLLHQYVHRVFWRLSREIGLRRPGDRIGPRVHDFRHRFAIRTLLDWHREGKNVEQQLPALSTYLGHACVRDGSVTLRARVCWPGERPTSYYPTGVENGAMRCIECYAADVSERHERTTRGYRRFRCRACGKQFNERSGGILNRAQYPSDVIALVIFWRLRYKLSLRDLPEMFLIRGIEFSYEAVRDWEAKLTPTLIDNLRRRRTGRIGKSWYVDETYIKVNGRWCYLYRAIDRSGALVDVRLSEKRDMAAAKAFFRSAKAVTGVTPARVTTDGHDSYPRAIRTELDAGVKHRTNQYLNTLLSGVFRTNYLEVSDL